MSARVDPSRWSKLVTRRLVVTAPSRRSSSIFSVRNLRWPEHAGNRQQARRFGAILRHGTFEPIFDEMPHAVDIYYPQWVHIERPRGCVNSFLPLQFDRFCLGRMALGRTWSVFHFDEVLENVSENLTDARVIYRIFNNSFFNSVLKNNMKFRNWFELIGNINSCWSFKMKLRDYFLFILYLQQELILLGWG